MIELEVFFINAFFLCLALSLLLILGRLRQGPSLADRVISIDLFTTLLLSAMGAAAIYVDNPLFFDVAIVVALFGFVGSVVFAKFIQGQARD